MKTDQIHPGRKSPSLIPKGWVLVLLLIAAAIFVGHSLTYWQWTEDDAFISIRYAQNLAEGQGLVFNPGEKVEGYSNFAWVLLAAGAIKLNIDPLLATKLLGILGGLLALYFSWQLACRLWPSSPAGALLAPFCLALTPVLPRHSVTGLETSFYAGIMVMAICLVDYRKRNWWQAFFPLLLILLALLRPEGVAFALLMLFWRLTPSAGDPEATESEKAELISDRESVRIDLITFVALFCVYYLWRWFYFGDPFANTFYFKMTGGGSALIDGVHYSLDFLRETGGAVLTALVLVLFFLRWPPRVYWLVLAAITGQVAFVILAGGDWMHFYRFYAPVMPLLASATAAGAALYSQWSKGDRRRFHVARIILVLVLFTAGVNVYKTEKAVFRSVMPTVEQGVYLTDSYQRLGYWLKDNTDPGAVIAISDVGAVGYFSQRKIIDMFGLIDSHIARQPGKLHYKQDSSYVLERKPDYVVLVANLSSGEPSFLRIPDQAMYQNPQFTRLYTPVRQFSIGYQSEEIMVYRRLDQTRSHSRARR